MLPDHNDGVGAGSDDDDDDDEEAAAGSKDGGRGAKGAKKGGAAEAPGGVVLPFRANKHVTGGWLVSVRAAGAGAKEDGWSGA